MFFSSVLRKFGADGPPPEDPDKLAQFRAQVLEAAWPPAKHAEDMRILFRAVDDLATAEVRYFFRRRRTRAALSGMFRTSAWICGTAGVLLPLLAATNRQDPTAWAPWGYVLLAAAASFLAANALFGGSSGHVRFVLTQLALESLITASRIEWCAFEANRLQGDLAPEAIQAGFDLIRAYAGKFYELSISETGQWGETLLAELNKYGEGVKRSPERS